MSEKLFRVVFIPATEHEIAVFENPEKFGIRMGWADRPLGHRLMKVSDFDKSYLTVSNDETYNDNNHSKVDLFTDEEINKINPKFMDFAIEYKENNL